ncbi:MAG TPA: NUDIX domain-containing protein [Solirubrobacterales bacterium]|nr:NUDIX domain-containing protein [Solirubrobacterales bacterium]
MSSPTAATLIDVVDGLDREVGRVARGEVLDRGENFRTAHVFVLNQVGELLLQRIGPRRLRHPDRWGSSVAAYLFAGETYEEAAARRLSEELGVQAPLRQLGKLEMRDEQSLKFVSLFLAHSDDVANREPDHIAELAFWPLSQLQRAVEVQPEMFTPTFVRLFQAFGGGFE